jgi:uncharacterized protein (TIGR00106 family)
VRSDGVRREESKASDWVIVEMSFVPLGVGNSLSPYVAEAVRLIRESGLRHEFHSMGTNVEGPYDAVMDLVKRCQDRIFEMGAPRLSTSLKISARSDRVPDMAAKKKHVEEILSSA